jgi:hypothetical protein
MRALARNAHPPAKPALERALLSRRFMKRDEARIATPCGADWKAMRPRGNARLCESCNKVVHDLSARSEAEARALLRTQPSEGLCIRYLHDADGNVWFGEPPGRIVPTSRLARGASVAVAAAALLVAPALVEACGGASPDGPGNYDNYAAGDAANTRREANPIVSAADAGLHADAGPADASDAAANGDDGESE